ncbi:MAG: GNAT family N-acetyltransferase [Rhabdochlamydiaceae bacterium]|nr:GNAT family N-acetyltransferase [Rhabdochlamydiaceae bacterium]
MTVMIRRAKIEDAQSIVSAEQDIAQEPGYFCSEPFELSEENVCKTIQSSQGIYLVAEKEGILVGHAFLEILDLQNLSHVAQLNIAVHKGYQGKGIGTQLMERIIEWAKQSGRVEKIELNVRASNTGAIALYKKMGFFEEGCLKRRVKAGDRYIDDLVMALHIKGDLPHRNISRVGVYGVVREGHKMLLVVQATGTYANRFDLPGGGIEFGETIEQALHREFLEEVGMDFKSMEPITNLTAKVEMPSKEGWPSYTFHQIGLIYSVDGLHALGTECKGSLKHDWIDLQTLKQEEVSPFVWAISRAEAL